MDDSEARYLIDQFNKYASWKARWWEIMFAFLAIIVAADALYLSSVPVGERFGLVWTIVAVVLVVIAFTTMEHDRRMRLGFEKRLTLLEGYRSRHKLVTSGALPDSVTFKAIIESKPEQLEKLLEESEPSERRKASARGFERILTGFWKRKISKGTARAFIGVIFMIAGFIDASFIPAFNMQTNSVAFNVYLSLAIGFFTSGMVLFAEGSIDRLTSSASP